MNEIDCLKIPRSVCDLLETVSTENSEEMARRLSMQVMIYLAEEKNEEFGIYPLVDNDCYDGHLEYALWDVIKVVIDGV